MKKGCSSEVLAVKYLGITSISLVLAIAICFLANLGYNTYIKIHNNKEIEVRAENSNPFN